MCSYIHFLLISVAFSPMFSVVSIFGNIYFTLGEYSTYHRGKYIIILMVIYLIYVIATSLLLFVDWRRMIFEEFSSLFSSGFFPIVGAVIQFLMPRDILIQACTTLSILMLHINIQNDRLRTDYLAGLYNRRCLDHYPSVEIKTRDNRLLTGLMIDLDSLKRTNDKYGHGSGDQALRNILRILRQTFCHQGFISCYGDDEFVVVMEVQDSCELKEILEGLHRNVEISNHQNVVPCEIELAIGCDCFDRKGGLTVSSFLTRIGRPIYLNKQENEEQNQCED